MVLGRELQRMSRAERDEAYRALQLSRGLSNFFTIDWVPGELERMPEVLGPDEDLLAYTTGWMDGDTWLMALTDQRILMLNTRFLTGMRQYFIELDQINTITTNRGVLNGSIAIQDGAVMREVSNVPNKAVNPFVNLTREAMQARKQPALKQPELVGSRFVPAEAPLIGDHRSAGELRRMLSGEREALLERMSKGMIGSTAKTAEPLARLQMLMADDERLLTFTNGTDELQDCLVALTDRRIVTLTSDKADGFVERAIPLPAITDLTIKRGPFLSRLTIEWGGEARRITGMPKRGVERFVSFVRDAREELQRTPPVQRGGDSDAAGSWSGGGLLDQLERLTQLHRSGALDDDEFARAKEQLLR